MRVLVLHAYSAHNKGDGLLVDETLHLIKQALGESNEIHLIASDPSSFAHLPIDGLHNSKPKHPRALIDYVRQLWMMRTYDVVVAVGGGYLRAGNCIEALKTLAIHGPQLLAATASRRPAIYLPQSIGPLRGPSGPLFRMLLRRTRKVFLRDDVSVRELHLPNTQRTNDLALMARPSNHRIGRPLHHRPILSVRHIRGRIPLPVLRLAEKLDQFDGYVQSSTGGNDDTHAMASISPLETVTMTELLGPEPSERRVVIAVRLHAALMALNAGHLVIHLAYERKGFGVFEDLGLLEYVHKVTDFDVDLVLHQIMALTHNADTRSSYEQAVAAARQQAMTAHQSIVDELARAAATTPMGV
ncbi:polysaccharide pyruvyl transferase family protein [Streptomyces sp. NP160]|uniref:polysaccharide pyruvyl transferase family protein n=1 Tax=Streptomyces sp. NP160 TaxID=2586637 RepID=UPI00111B2801|nr:polysaccharide pyruvyl transferase family protein [Streptomyces sp. NP160]TNM59465.1 polysaccharide pyruvyl transferase family protein [Streptomyces sp. NP160]